MQLKEQTAGNSPPILRTHRPPPPQTRQTTPLRKGAGHQTGIHPEDTPYHTTTQRGIPGGIPQNRHPAPILPETLEDDEVYTQARMPTVVRRYNRQPALPQTQIKEETGRLRTTPTRFFFIAIGIILLAFVLAIIILYYILPAYTRWNDTRIYGYPRTTHARAIVGHGAVKQPDSDFTGENINGYVYVWEIEATSAPTVAHVYYIIQLTGTGNDLIPITSITFSDMNGDGKPDMLVTLENGSTFVLYNTGTSFSQQDPTRK